MFDAADATLAFSDYNDSTSFSSIPDGSSNDSAMTRVLQWQLRDSCTGETVINKTLQEQHVAGGFVSTKQQALPTYVSADQPLTSMHCRWCWHIPVDWIPSENIGLAQIKHHFHNPPYMETPAVVQRKACCWYVVQKSAWGFRQPRETYNPIACCPDAQVSCRC